jgi:hypothetical protein
MLDLYKTAGSSPPRWLLPLLLAPLLLAACGPGPWEHSPALHPEPLVVPADSLARVKDCVGLDEPVERTVRWLLVDAIEHEACARTCAGLYIPATHTIYVNRFNVLRWHVVRHEAFHALLYTRGDLDAGHRDPRWAACGLL